MNYKKINSYKKFINIMKEMTDEEKFAFLYDYFDKNVSYNYSEWLYSDLLSNSFPKDPSFDEYYGELNPKKKKMILCSLGDITIYNEDDLKKGFSKVPFVIQLPEIRKKYDLNKISDIDSYKKEVFDLINTLYIDNIDNEEIKEYLNNVVMEDIINISLVPYKYEDEDALYIYDIPWMIYDSYHEGDRCKSEFHNGLIKRGVCRNFSAFIKKVLDDLGIDTVNVIGKSNRFHEWNMVNINGDIKFIDISKEIHIRDNACSNGCNKGDWYLIDIDRMFELEPTREIVRLNDVDLDSFITKDNYKENMDVLIDAFKHKVKVKKKQLRD